MELKEGMYVRTKKYGIAKIIGGVTTVLRTFNIDKFKKDGITLRCQREQDIIKASHNIIDLIEVGDYVNGKKVIDTYTDYIFDYTEEFKVIRFSETDILHSKEHIKSIVTKEQFESMKYSLEG